MNILMTVIGSSNLSASCIIITGASFLSHFFDKGGKWTTHENFQIFIMWTEKVEQREGNGLVKEAVHLIH